MLFRRISGLAVVFICVFVSYFAANLLSSYYLPTRGQPRVIDWNARWLGIDKPTHQAFFRHIFDVPFEPDDAWIAIASDQYNLYLNGVLVSRNEYVANMGQAFQSRVSQRNQALTRVFTTNARAPEARRGPNRERAMPQFVNVSSLVRPGRNILAVALQSSDTAPVFSIAGAISNPARQIEIGTNASDWSASVLPDRIGNLPWIQSTARQDGWGSAVEVDVDIDLMAGIDPRIWSVPFPDTAVSGPQVGNEIRLRRLITDLSWRGATDGAWVRVRSSWPYALLIDGDLVVEANPTRAIAVHDITSYLTTSASQLSVRMTRPLSGPGAQEPPIFALDGFMDGRHLSGTVGWQALFSNDPDWATGTGDWGPVTTSRFPSETSITNLQREGRPVSWTWRFLLVWAGCAAGLALGWKVLAAMLRLASRVRAPKPHLAAAILAIPSLTLVLLVLLRLRFKESDTTLWFIHPDFRLVMVSLVAASFGATILWLSSAQRFPAIPRSAPDSGIPKQLAILALMSVMAIGLYLRMKNLGLEDLQADENVSLDAAIGILRTGLPEAVSGVLYTRSPLYHYLLAGWIWVFGDTSEGARSFSVLAGVATIGAAYLFARLVGASRALALLIALWLAIDPWQITVSRNIRFYQQMQFFGLLGFIFFLKGFILGRDRRAQTWFFAAITGATLSQEVFVITFPGLCIAGYFYYRPFRLSEDWRIILGGVTVLTITIVDLTIFQIMCLTAHVGIGTSSGSILQLHALNIMAFFSTFFSGTLRSHFLLTVAFFFGLMFRPRVVSPALGFCYIIVLVTILVATVLVVQVANRYLYVLMPVFVTTAVVSIRNVAVHWGQVLLPGRENGHIRARWSGLVLSLLAVAAVIGSEVWRTVGSYEERTIVQHESAYRFIHANMQPGDKVVSVSPMSGAIVLGGVDYYLLEWVFFDEVYKSIDDGIIDRWAGGQLVSSANRLNNVLLSNDRVWIVLDEFETKKMSNELLSFINTVTEPKLAFFGGTLRLWDRNDSRYLQVRDLNQGLASF